jgi:hypothetical protein
MTLFQLNACPKPSHKRNKPTAKQRGSVSPSVRLQLAARSNGRCECCGRGGIALQAAHTIRRWKVESRTTVNELAHLCVECHVWADTTGTGRVWLEEFRSNL